MSFSGTADASFIKRYTLVKTQQAILMSDVKIQEVAQTQMLPSIYLMKIMTIASMQNMQVH